MKKRSHISHKFTGSDCVTGERNGYMMPLLMSNRETEIERRRRFSLCDLTALNRVGFRGLDIIQWLKEQHNIIAPAINQAIKVQQSLLVVRLSHTEILIFEDIEDQEDRFTKIMEKTGTESISMDHPDIYHLPYQDSHSCFMICGKHCAELFAKLCAVDLRVHKFPNMGVAQTSLARINAIIIRRDLADTQGYFILVASSLVEYLWDCLLDAMQEFDGNVVGYDVIRFQGGSYLTRLNQS